MALQFSGQSVFEKTSKYFLHILIIFLCKYSSHIVDPAYQPPPHPPGSLFEQSWIYTTWECFYTRFGFSDQFLSKKNIFTDFYLYFPMLKFVAPLWPTYPQRSWFEQFLINITRGLQSNLQLLWSFGFFYRKKLSFYIYFYLKIWLSTVALTYPPRNHELNNIYTTLGLFQTS